MNRSDTVTVASVASGPVLGIYGLASQIENALTTAALIPSGAVVAYTAKSKSSQEARTVGIAVMTAVAVAYLCLSIPFLVFTTPLIELVFGTHISDPLPFQICAVAGLFSCLGGVAMQQLIGLGKQGAAATIWAIAAPVAVTLLLVGTALFGAVGAAVAALLRDLLFFTMTVLTRARAQHESGV
jgi:O-antigen/teichoic acid export membrane protein